MSEAAAPTAEFLADALDPTELDHAIPVAAPRYRDLSWGQAVWRRASSRLARHFVRAPRRLLNARPLVSFTFDDAPISAYALGAPMLERAGARGVFYVVSGFLGRRTTQYRILEREHVRDLHRRGHEIGLHGCDHCPVPWLDPEALRRDIERSRAELAEIDAGIAAPNFAYPFGLVAVERKRLLAGLTLSSRSVRAGFNAVDFDAQYLLSVELSNARLAPAALREILDAARQARGWLIFTIHDVSNEPSPFGGTPELLRSAIEGATARGFEIVTAAHALAQSVPARPRLAIPGR